MNPYKLFRSRVVGNFKYQIRSIRMVIDWTVALYIVIPALFVVGVVYSGLWSVLPLWTQYIPYSFLAAIIYFALCIGEFRYFIQAGDQLFIIYNRIWMQALISYGSIYSITAKLLQASLWIGLAAPLLVKKFHLSVFALIGLCLFTALYGFMIILLKSTFRNRWIGKVKQSIALMAVYGIGLVIYLVIAQILLTYPWIVYGMTILAILFVLALLRSKLTQNGFYIQDIEREYKAKTKINSLVMKDDEAFKVPVRRKRPLLFHRSQRLFRKSTSHHGIAEFIIKGFFRNSSQMLSYAQLTIVTMSGLWLAPEVSKWILWLFVLIMLVMWTKTASKNMLTADIMSLFRIESVVQIKAITISTFWMTLPAFMLLSIILGVALYGPIGIPIMMILAPIVCKFISSILSNF
jgi:ABC-2 type transport system permease protein